MEAAFLTFIFGGITACFAYLAYCFSWQRFRLDLLDKRWEVYENILMFCSCVLAYGGLPKDVEHDTGEDVRKTENIRKALSSASESFRGPGLHKAKSLFGEDVYDTLDKLSAAFAWFVSDPTSAGWEERKHEQLRILQDLSNRLPEIFKPYIYFGDYRHEVSIWKQLQILHSKYRSQAAYKPKPK